MKFKKGAIEIQFNWIFVLIIGAVILIIFSSIILKQKGVSETSKNVLILNNLDAILSGSETSAGTVNMIRMPETEIEFSCKSYSIGELSKQIDVMNVFSPKILEDSNLISMTLDFSMPYRIINLIYLTEPQYRYILIGEEDNELKNQIIQMLPDEIFFEEFSDVNDVNYRGEDKTRFVFFDVSVALPPDFFDVPDKDVNALRIDGTLESGNIEFFQKEGNDFTSSGSQNLGSSNYLGTKTLLGAIISDDKEIYECSMKDIFEKINIVTDIYKEKTERIKQIYSQENDRCSAFEQTIYSLDHLNKISLASEEFKSTNIGTMSQAATDLRSQNRQAQLQSCATIY
jgi:hypothetical protein|tara:strand:- start:122 stop:1150 length:1029 start_codon:yes stop_codon:yes gene_type:complete